jgi:hypothetical protein|tara:strand:- start:2943 stop:3329 length:387 start_codon:yes stop_codon:yes gene_type:complete
MHPEIKSKLNELGRKWLANALERKDHHLQAAEARYISFDDIYFLGVFNGAETIALQNLVDTDQAPIAEANESVPFPTVIQDDMDFKTRESQLAHKLTSELYHCSPEDTEERWEGIYINIDKYFKDQRR